MAQLACKDKMGVHVKNKVIIAKNKKLGSDLHIELLTEDDVDKEWLSSEWCTWKVNFYYVLFSSLCLPKENFNGSDIETDDEVSSEGDDDDFSDD